MSANVVSIRPYTLYMYDDSHILTLTLNRWQWGRCEKNYPRKEGCGENLCEQCTRGAGAWTRDLWPTACKPRVRSSMQWRLRWESRTSDKQAFPWLYLSSGDCAIPQRSVFGDSLGEHEWVSVGIVLFMITDWFWCHVQYISEYIMCSHGLLCPALKMCIGMQEHTH